MTYDEFLEKHKPIQNHIDKNAGFDGMMFETIIGLYESNN